MWVSSIWVCSGLSSKWASARAGNHLSILCPVCYLLSDIEDFRTLWEHRLQHINNFLLIFQSWSYFLALFCLNDEPQVVCTSLCPVVWAAPWSSSCVRMLPCGPLLVPLVLCAGPACPGLGGWARRALLSVSLCPQQGTVKAKGNFCLWKQPKSYGGNSWWGFQRSGWHRFRASQYFSFCRWDLLGFVSPFLGSQEQGECLHLKWFGSIVNASRMARTCILLAFS